MPRTIIHTATGEFRDEQNRFLYEGLNQGWTMAGCPVSPNSEYTRVTLPEGVVPDPRTQRWDGVRVVAKSAQAIADLELAEQRARFTATSRQKDIYAMCALVVRSRGITAWNNMTIAQRVAATNTEADAWKVIREFVDDKV